MDNRVKKESRVLKSNATLQSPKQASLSSGLLGCISERLHTHCAFPGSSAILGQSSSLTIGLGSWTTDALGETLPGHTLPPFGVATMHAMSGDFQGKSGFYVCHGLVPTETSKSHMSA